MSAERVTDMTVEELKALIAEVVDERLRNWLWRKEPVDKRRLKEILDSIDRHRWTSPPGTPSTLELLCEDRDR